MDTILPKQPSSNRVLLKRSFILYQWGFSKVFLLAFLFSISVFMPRILSYLSGYDITQNMAMFGWGRVWIVVNNFVSLILFIGILWDLYCVSRNISEPFIEDIEQGLKKILYVFVATIVQNAIVFAVAAIMMGLQILLYQHNLVFQNNPLAIILTVIAFVGEFALLLYIATLFVFFIPLIAIENKGIFSSIEKSVLITWNHWWRVFSFQITPWVCYLVLLLFIRLFLNINVHIYFMEEVLHSPLIIVFHILIFAMFIPWVAAVMLVQLRDLEIRKELVQARAKSQEI